jgi:hypothetical protein
MIVVCSCALLVAAFVPDSAAQTASVGGNALAGTVLARNVLSAGAVSAAGTLFRIQGTIGQPVIGLTQQTSVSASQGFWYSAAAKIPAEVLGPESAPAALTIENHPNPFVASTTVQYILRKDATIRLSVFDACGREVRVLLEADLKAGTHSAVWDGKDQTGAVLASGYYICTIRALGVDAGLASSLASIKAVLVR